MRGPFSEDVPPETRRWTVFCYDCNKAWPAMTRDEAANAAADHMQETKHRPRILIP